MATKYGTPSASNCSATAKSTSALRNHLSQISHLTASGDLIDNSAVFMCWVGNIADDFLTFLKNLRRHDDDIERMTQVHERLSDPKQFSTSARRSRSRIIRSMSLCLPIRPVDAEPNIMMRSACVTDTIR